MAAYRMKVTYKADGKVYAPGSILPSDMSSSDLAFLKSKKFVELVKSNSLTTNTNLN